MLGSEEEVMNGTRELLACATIGLAAVYPTAAFAADPCAHVDDHVSERTCLEFKAESSANAVKAAETKVREAISAWADTEELRERVMRNFNAAAEAHATYLAAACEFAWSASAGGNGATDMRLSCREALNKDYLRELAAKEKWFAD
jgi:hypothetical protein